MIGCLKLAIGEIGALPDMVDAASGIANLYFVTFVFIVVSCLSCIMAAPVLPIQHSQNGANAIHDCCRSLSFSTFFLPSLLTPISAPQTKEERVSAWLKMLRLQ
jgi:hypothetical protein